MTTTQERTAVQVPHVVKGERLTGTDCEYGRAGARFATPALDLNSAGVAAEASPGPRSTYRSPRSSTCWCRWATGWRSDPEGLLEEALVAARRTSPLPAEVVDRSYAHLPKVFDRASMEFQIRTELGGPDVLDGWREVVDAPSGRVHRIRAFPPRLIHVIAGNSPGVAAVSIVRGALIKGVNLIKLPSNDLFTAPAILQAMAHVAPGPSGDPLVLRGLLARRRRAGGGHAVPPAVLRQARRLGWRRARS